MKNIRAGYFSSSPVTNFPHYPRMHFTGRCCSHWYVFWRYMKKKKMKKHLPLFSLFAGILLFASCMNTGSQNDPGDTQLKLNVPAEDDMKFVKDAADGGMRLEEHTSE